MMNNKLIFSMLAVVIVLTCVACGPKVILSSEEGATVDQLLDLKAREILVAIIETNKGSIELELYAKDTPLTVKNFVTLSLRGYYNGLLFHRVIRDFMIQGGDPKGTGEGGESIYGKFFDDEIVSKYHFDEAGVLAMANAGLNTNGSQFFITSVATPWLDRKHTIFGKVIGGMSVVVDISKVKVDRDEKLVEDVAMEKIIIQKRAG